MNFILPKTHSNSRSRYVSWKDREGTAIFWALTRGKHRSARWHFKYYYYYFLFLSSFPVVVWRWSSTQARISSISSFKNLVQFLSCCYQHPNKHPNMFIVSLLSIPWRSKTRLQSFHLSVQQQLSYVFLAENLHYLHHFSSINLHTATVAQIAETASKRVYECWTSGSPESLSFFTYIMCFWNLNWRI